MEAFPAERGTVLNDSFIRDNTSTVQYIHLYESTTKTRTLHFISSFQVRDIDRGEVIALRSLEYSYQKSF